MRFSPLMTVLEPFFLLRVSLDDRTSGRETMQRVRCTE